MLVPDPRRLENALDSLRARRLRGNGIVLVHDVARPVEVDCARDMALLVLRARACIFRLLHALGHEPGPHRAPHIHQPKSPDRRSRSSSPALPFRSGGWNVPRRFPAMLPYHSFLPLYSRPCLSHGLSELGDYHDYRRDTVPHCNPGNPLIPQIPVQTIRSRTISPSARPKLFVALPLRRAISRRPALPQ